MSRICISRICSTSVREQRLSCASTPGVLHALVACIRVCCSVLLVYMYLFLVAEHSGNACTDAAIVLVDHSAYVFYGCCCSCGTCICICSRMSCMTSLEICWYSWCMHTPGVPHLRASLRSWMSALVGHATSAVSVCTNKKKDIILCITSSAP